MDYNEMAQELEKQDREARKVEPVDFYAIQPKPEQSRVDWENKGRRPGR